MERHRHSRRSRRIARAIRGPVHARRTWGGDLPMGCCPALASVGPWRTMQVRGVARADRGARRLPRSPIPCCAVGVLVGTPTRPAPHSCGGGTGTSARGTCSRHGLHRRLTCPRWGRPRRVPLAEQQTLTLPGSVGRSRTARGIGAGGCALSAGSSRWRSSARFSTVPPGRPAPCLKPAPCLGSTSGSQTPLISRYAVRES